MYICVYTYIYMALNHFAVPLKLTQHCKSTILQLKKKRNSEVSIFSMFLFLVFSPCNKEKILQVEYLLPDRIWMLFTQSDLFFLSLTERQANIPSSNSQLLGGIFFHWDSAELRGHLLLPSAWPSEPTDCVKTSC